MDSKTSKEKWDVIALIGRGQGMLVESFDNEQDAIARAKTVLMRTVIKHRPAN